MAHATQNAFAFISFVSKAFDLLVTSLKTPHIRLSKLVLEILKDKAKVIAYNYFFVLYSFIYVFGGDTINKTVIQSLKLGKCDPIDESQHTVFICQKSKNSSELPAALSMTHNTNTIYWFF